MRILVIDDGSTAGTVETARAIGVDHIAFNRQRIEIRLEKVRDVELKLARMEEERRTEPRPLGGANVELAGAHGEVRLLAHPTANGGGPGGTAHP